MMLKKFLILLTAFATLLHAADYLIDGVDPNDSTTYYDYDKVWDDDKLLCWAYSAANVLQYWQDKQSDFYIDLNSIPDGSSSGIYESAIVAAFVAAWDDELGYEFDAFSWWLTDTAGVYQSGDLDDELYPSGGGYWSDYFTGDSSIYTWTGVTYKDSSLLIDLMGASIDMDSPMILSIIGSSGGHAITVWGYGVDEKNQYYLYVTDSDDSIDGMVIVYMTYNETYDTWYLADYYDTSWYVSRITTLDVGVLDLPVPEPSTVSLCLLAFAGLYRRRRKAA